MKNLKTVTLEMSLKPFKDNSDVTMDAVCREVFLQWLALTRHAETISILLWVAEGSDILEYTGNLDDEFEWAHYFGLPKAGHYKDPDPNDPDEIGLCRKVRDYIENPPSRTYGWLKQLVARLKYLGKEITGKQIRVGATFDPGPEFAKSSFKYEIHPEIVEAVPPFKSDVFIHCDRKLHHDERKYAGFQDGIPEGTSIGTFLGRQCNHYLPDIGFDYVWFSNAFGFGLETWGGSGVFCVGSVFDGDRFHSEKTITIRDSIIGFWKDFRRECPEFRVETRGSNLPTGLMLGADAVPTREIYNGGFNIESPPNSPWAALDGDFGIELVGWMSRIAELPPGDHFPFRFYIHDPWWLTSPWINQYGREPHDIYLPLSISRIDSKGALHTPGSVAFLSIDDSHGEMPVSVPNEVIPHILEGFSTAPDHCGPLLWIYPFEEYHNMTFENCSEDRLMEIMFGDLFMRGAINNGLPLNTVISSSSFVTASSAGKRFLDTVLVVPSSALIGDVRKQILKHVEIGGKVLVYGPLDHVDQEVLDVLGVSLRAPLSDNLEIKVQGETDVLTQGSYPSRICHNPLLSGGGIREFSKASVESGDLIASVGQGADNRAVALFRCFGEWKGGAIAWVRGTNSFGMSERKQPFNHDPNQWFYSETLVRTVLAKLGIEIFFHKPSIAHRNPIVMISRYRNAFFFSGYLSRIDVEQYFKFPQGAPLFTGLDTRIVKGRTVYHSLPKAWRRECRVFVEQAEGDDEISCQSKHSAFPGISKRLYITGLNNATIRFFHEPGTEDKVTMLQNPLHGFLVGERVVFEAQENELGSHLLAHQISGALVISW